LLTESEDNILISKVNTTDPDNDILICTVKNNNNNNKFDILTSISVNDGPSLSANAERCSFAS